MYEYILLSVKVDFDCITNIFQSLTGVRQVDNCSPNLFNLFVNDIPEIFYSSCMPVSLNHNSNTFSCLMYADDLILLSETPSGFQNCLDKLSIYCDKWGLEINVKKSKVLIFNNTED